MSEAAIPKRRVFVSFDTKHDAPLKDFFLRQAQRPDAPFKVVGHSIEITEPRRNWEFKTGRAIQSSEILVIMVGPYTYVSAGVKHEVAMARDEEVPIVQVVGYKGGKYKPVPMSGRLYPWSWENMKQLLR